MKNFKRIIPYLVAVVVSLAIMLAAGCSCSSCKKDDPRVLQSISINTDAVKKDYVFDQEFTSEGLVVTATYLKKENSKKTVEVVLEADEYTVNSKAFKKNAEGTYTIIVSYTHKEVTLEQSYDVTVTTYMAGLEVTLVEGVLSSNDEEKIDTFTLTAEKKNVEIDTSKITVKEVNKDGTVGNAITDYKVSLYKGQEAVTLTNGKATVGGGAYAILVEKDSDVFDNYPLVAFAMVYINDNIVSIELRSGVTTQHEGVDSISGTWSFTVTYTSGATKVISSKDCVFSINTMSIGSRVASVTYTEFNVSGDELTKSFDVPYTITEFDGTRNNYNYSYSKITGVSTDKTVLNQSHFVDSNSFLKVNSEAEVTYRTSPALIEVKGAGLFVTFEGTGTITIGFSSTGGSNQSRVGLKGPDGKYIPATYNTTNANITPDDSLDDDGYVYENVYLVKGTGSCQFTFIITEPGTYAIASEPNAAYNRGCRLHSISMIDYVPNSAAAASLSADNQTYITYKKVERV